MAVKTGTRSTARLTAGLSAIALGAALLALPGAALAQDDHRHDGAGRGNPPHEQQARPAPAAPAPMQGRPAQNFPPPAARGESGRGPGQFGGQQRPAPGNGNGNGNGWQGRQQQPNFAPGQGRPAFQGRPTFQGQAGFQGQARGDNAGRADGGQYRNDGGPARNDRGPGGYNGGPGRNDGGPGRYDGGHYDGGHHDGGHGYGRGDGQWDHGWRQDNRYDWRGWRDQNRDAFHVGRYYPPYRDYSYNRLGIGFYLQPMFFGSDYWIADPYYYHLPPAYGPYHWVRYYNDAILVNTYNGQVADVIYDFFW